MWQFAHDDIYTPIDSDTPPHSMTIFAVKTSANCSKAAKFAEVFTPERFPLYGITNQLSLPPSLHPSLPLSLCPSLSPSLPQMDYEGAIKASSPPDSGRSSPFPQELPYSITSITDHRISLQEGDQVRVHHHQHEFCSITEILPDNTCTEITHQLGRHSCQCSSWLA